MNIDALTAYLALSSGSYSGILRDMYAVHNLGLNPDLHTKLLANRFVGGTKELSGIPPLSFTAKGKPLTAWSITGNTVQNGTPTPENPVEVVGVGDRTANLFDYSTITTGYRIVWTTGDLYKDDRGIMSDFIEVTEGQKYQISDSTKSLTAYIIGYNQNKEYLGAYDSFKGFIKSATNRCSVLTIPKESGCQYIKLMTFIGYPINATSMFIEGEAVPNEFIPYGYKIPVLTRGTRGKNLFDYKTMYGVKGKYLSVNGEVLDSSAWAVTDYIPCSGNVFTINPIGGKIPAICLYDSQKNYITGLSYNTGGVNYKKSVTIRSEINASYIRFSYYINSDKDAADLSKIQIEIGDTATPYEPYHEPITTPIYLPTPLYSGEVMRSDGSREVKWGKLVLTGEETWNIESINNFYNDQPITNALKYHTVFCTHQKSVSPTFHSSNENCFISSSGKFNFQTSTIEHKVEAFKSWLAAQYAAGTPVTVWYQLVKPTTETFTAPQIPTINGTTVIDVDTAVKPESMTIKYRR